MIRIRNRQRGIKFIMIFLLALGGLLTIFILRVVTGRCASEERLGIYINKTSRTYTLGTVYDRNKTVVVSGKDCSLEWQPGMESLYGELLGVDLEESLLNRFSLVSKATWLYDSGAENQLTLEGLVQPGRQRIGGALQLTLDSELMQYMADLVSENGYEDAHIVVSDFSNGEILGVFGDIQEEVFSPGSVMKPILAAAVLSIDSSYAGYTYNCTSDNHDFSYDGQWIHVECAGKSLHGSGIDMETAIAKSCNGYFVSLVSQIDKVQIEQKLMGFGFDSTTSYSSFVYNDQIFLQGSSVSSDYMLGAIGQANAKSSVIGINSCYAALLNKGILKDPTFFMATAYHAGDSLEPIENGESTIVSEDVATTVCGYLESVMTEGTGRSFAFESENGAMFVAKTGTAQKGTSEDGEDIYTVWTAGGLVNDSQHPYAITVCLDDVNADVTSSNAGQMAKSILEYLVTR